MTLHERPLNLEAWDPTLEDRPLILKILLDSFTGTLAMCGDGEEAAEDLDLYKKVALHSLADCKGDIQEFFLDLYYAVNGDIERYYDDSEFKQAIRLTLGMGA
jgi:hypothetical protein